MLTAAWCVLLILTSRPACADTLLSPEIEKILALPEDQIDVGIAALTFAKQVYPDIDIQAYSRQIDELADEVKALNASFPKPNRLLWSLDQVLYKRQGFSYDQTHTRRTYFINGLLDTKSGTCSSMTALYIAVAQRVGLHPLPVSAPHHIFARYTGLGLLGFGTLNIETTQGVTPPDEAYARDFHIPEKGIKSGAYLRGMTYREYLGLFLYENALAMRPSDNPAIRDRSNAIMERAIGLAPLAADVYRNLAESYAYESQFAGFVQGNTRLATLFQDKARAYLNKAEDLGVGTAMENAP